MNFDDKVSYLIEDLRKQGVSPYESAPPVFRLFLAIGVQVPPPMFWGFLPILLVAAVFFGLFWGTFMWLWWHGWPPTAPTVFEIVMDVLAGLLFGLAMASYYRAKMRKLRLPTWSQYPPGAQIAVDETPSP
jgi:hypothetical protein